MSTFANRRSRCKELGKKVPQAYRVYVEDTFLPCDAADARIFAKENFLSLYNALHHTNLQLSCPVENIRLDNVMYMNIINDVSCLVDGKIIVLAEHQSTINENMPRQGMYFRVHSLTSSFELCSKHRKAKTTAIRGGTEMTFANRRSRYKAQTKNTRRRAFCTSRTVFCEVTQ